MAEKQNRFKLMGQSMYSSKSKPNSAEEETNIVLNNEVPEQEELSNKSNEETTNDSSTPIAKKLSGTKKNTGKKQNNNLESSDKDTIKDNKVALEKEATKPTGSSQDISYTEKRGRKKGTVFVQPEERRKTISISVDPRDEEIYRQILKKYPKRFKGLSQLVEQALDYFIEENNLN